LPFYSAFNFEDVKSNNLGGQGPNTDDPEEIRFASILPGIDLVITADSNYEAPPLNEDADPGRRGVGNNGIYGNLGAVDLKVGTSSELTHSFVDSSTGDSVTLNDISFTIWGLTGANWDHEAQSFSREFNLRTSNYNLSADTTVNVIKEDAGIFNFTSTVKGSVGDLPTDSNNPSKTALSQAVTMSLQDVSSFKIKYDIAIDPEHSGEVNTGRMYLWSGSKLEVFRQIISQYQKDSKYVLDWCWADSTQRATPCTGDDKNNVYVHTMNDESDAANQLWYYDSHQRLVVDKDKTMCLSVKQETASNVLVDECSEDDNQKWSVPTMASGTDMAIKSLFSKSNGLCLDWCKDNVDSCKAGTTNNVYVRACNSEAWQTWQWA
jgi:hypothetical protein